MYNIDIYTILGEPNILPPTSPPLVLTTFISLTCGQDVTVPTLLGLSSIGFTCSIFNGSEPLTMILRKDNVTISNSFSHNIFGPDDDDFGTYAFILSNDGCGSDIAVSRILRQGQ